MLICEEDFKNGGTIDRNEGEMERSKLRLLLARCHRESGRSRASDPETQPRK